MKILLHFDKGWPCSNCGEHEGAVHEKSGKCHLFCAGCENYLGEMPTPEHIIKRHRKRWKKKKGCKKKRNNRKKSHKGLVGKRGAAHCEMCLAKKSSVEERGLRLEAHHVIPYKDGGSSDVDNIWFLCSPCHLVVENRRRKEKRRES